MNKKTVLEILNILIPYFNDTRKVALDFSNPFTLLVATVLSAQATDKQVNKISPALFAVADTPEKMASLSESEIKEYIKSINLCNTKAKHILELSKKLVNDFNSVVPDNMKDLTSLAGVGRKTANIILSVVYHKNAIAVDTHVFRICRKIGFSKNAKTPTETELQLYKIIPEKYQQEINHCLVLLGREICKAQKPQCENCPIKHLCEKNE